MIYMDFSWEYFYMLFFFISFFFLFLTVGVGFFTVFERKMMGSYMSRMAPNKIGILGLLQPFSDALKLMSKEFLYPLLSNLYLYLTAPIFMFWGALMIWLSMVEVFNEWMSMSYCYLYLFCIMSLNVYIILISGWMSKSMYSMESSVRSVAQSVSYEVNLIFIMLIFFLMIEGMSFFKIYEMQGGVYYIFDFFIIFFFTLLVFLAELNRSPFDLLESESELISGYNLEYGGMMFGMYFMSENLMIIFWSMILVFFFFGGGMMSYMFFFKVLLMLVIFIWYRMIYPRYRYDKLMEMMWVGFLLFFLFLFLYIYGIKFLYFSVMM
uniref:NADH-ubiquinone oxidoreductase chain 1 n=1 Tax=Tremex columba TaxID=222809 RepID=A0A3G5BC73_TRECO|nr:NADH dehydrogenase subunit 1 [Tremex columba]AYV97242.1 NADH dehydrogenase subunit 1 [Tremex columba]